MAQTYTIKPLAWKEWNMRRYNLDGSTQIKTHYTASSILNYEIGPLAAGGYNVMVSIKTSTGGEDFYDEDQAESLDAAKEWCNKHLLDYLIDALEPTLHAAELEQWLKDNAPEEWFAGYNTTESALKALRNYRDDIATRDKMLAAWAAQPNQRQLIDAQAAELIKLRAQVAELGVTVEELQAMLRERIWDVDRKNAMIAERDATIRDMLLDAKIANDERQSLLAWVNEAKDAARGILGYVPDGADVDADYDKLHELLLQ